MSTTADQREQIAQWLGKRHQASYRKGEKIQNPALWAAAGMAGLGGLISYALWSGAFRKAVLTNLTDLELAQRIADAADTSETKSARLLELIDNILQATDELRQSKEALSQLKAELQRRKDKQSEDIVAVAEAAVQKDRAETDVKLKTEAATAELRAVAKQLTPSQDRVLGEFVRPETSLPISVSDLTEVVGFHRSTVYRVLHELRDLGLAKVSTTREQQCYYWRPTMRGRQITECPSPKRDRWKNLKEEPA